MAWLATFLAGILEPIIQKAIDNAFVAYRLDQIAKNQDAINAAFALIAKAKTAEEKDNALDALVKSTTR